MHRRWTMVEGDEDWKALLMAFDRWEAAADDFQLLRSDVARGVEVPESRLTSAHAHMEACWAAWQQIASWIQPGRASAQ